MSTPPRGPWRCTYDPHGVFQGGYFHILDIRYGEELFDPAMITAVFWYWQAWRRCWTRWLGWLAVGGAASSRAPAISFAEVML